MTKKLKKILKKLFKKDKVRYGATLNKIEEILRSNNIDHYKNLRYSMKNLKRVHIDSHFVLVFEVNKKEKVIKFYDLQHHDTICN